jgi:tetratricopeptide (TPR) repeat protein
MYGGIICKSSFIKIRSILIGGFKMGKKNIFVIFFLLVLTFIAYGNSDLDVFLGKIKNYLNSQYVEEAKLLKASTISKPDSKRIYIASDNLLAGYALSLLSCPLGEIVKKELEKYSKGFDDLHEVILGVKIPDEFYGRKNEYVGFVFSKKFGPIEIFYEKPDKNRIINDWYNYADLLVYKALNYLLDGKLKDAVDIYEKLMRMWDDWGFRDKVASKSGSYETYKVALGLFLSKKLEKIDKKITENYQEAIEKMKKNYPVSSG